MTNRTINRTAIKFDMILGADTHIREDTPLCRTDDYQNAQWTKLDFIRKLCDKHDCPFLCAGDIFDHWKPSPWILSRCLELMPKFTICIPGQHDLPQHSLQELAKTGLNTLIQAGRVITLTGGLSYVIGRSNVVIGYAYGETAQAKPDQGANRHILLMHKLVCHKKQPWPDAGADEALKLLAKYKHYDLIVTGDNHQQFAVRSGDANRWLVNPGSMMRMTADQCDFEPAVYGWNASDECNPLTRIPLPIKAGVVSQEHLGKEKREDRDVRMESYIVRAKKQFETRLSFTHNLKQHFRKNKESKAIERLVWKAVEGE